MAVMAAILHLNDFKYFQSACRLDTSYQVSSQFGLSVHEKFKIDLKDGWIFDRNDFSYFWFTNYHDSFCRSFESTGIFL